MTSSHDKYSLFQAKIDLTATLRWADRLGFTEGICNHFSMLVPGTTDRFLLNPQGIHWSELKASDLLIVNPEGHVLEGKHQIEPTALFIHSRIHLNRPSAKCILHTHMPYATALTCLAGGRLEWCSQSALRYYGRVAYDETFNGLALDVAEGDRMCARLGDCDILFLANHGVIVVGDDLACAFDDLYYLERVCQLQVLAHSTGLPLKIISEEVCQATFEQIKDSREQSYLFLEAIKRILTRESPEFLE
ncbi:MAG: aldolase [Pirellulaceae bacterium]|nr:aldolase [Pirellulaceae bacterium]